MLSKARLLLRFIHILVKGNYKQAKYLNKYLHEIKDAKKFWRKQYKEGANI